MRKTTGVLLQIVGLGIIIAVRVAGIDMTEGQIVCTYWHCLLLGVASMGAGMLIIQK